MLLVFVPSILTLRYIEVIYSHSVKITRGLYFLKGSPGEVMGHVAFPPAVFNRVENGHGNLGALYFKQIFKPPLQGSKRHTPSLKQQNRTSKWAETPKGKDRLPSFKRSILQVRKGEFQGDKLLSLNIRLPSKLPSQQIRLSQLPC